MKPRAMILENKSLLNLFRVATFFAAIYLLINLFVIGGDAFVQQLNEYPSPILATIGALLSIHLWSTAKPSETARSIWGLLAVGITLWGMATVTWAFYSLVLLVELPYPSLADLFWLAGYAFIGAALFRRYRTFKTSLTLFQKRLIYAISIATILLVAVFILRPILEDFDPARWLESILNILYPLADVTLFILSLIIILTMKEGINVVPWQFLAVGFALTSFSDLLFVYAAWYGLYYPNGQVNLISVVSDYADVMSYLFTAIGLVVQINLSRSVDSTKIITIEDMNASPTKAYLLIFTNELDEMISFGGNLSRLIKTPSTEDLVGMPLETVLGLDKKENETLFNQIKSKGFVSEKPLTILNRIGEQEQVWVSALATYNTRKQYTGANIVVRIHVTGDSAANVLGVESQSMADYILTQTGAEHQLFLSEVATYFKEVMVALYTLVRETAGPNISSTMIDRFNHASNANGWKINFDGQRVEIDQTSFLKDGIKAARHLYTEMVTYAADVTSLQSVQAALAKSEKTLQPEILIAAREAGLNIA